MAAGRSERMGGIDKIFAPLRHIPAIGYALMAFDRCDDIAETVVVTRPDALERVEALANELRIAKPLRTVCGGATRQASSLAGVRALSPTFQFAAVHDAARPLISPENISACVKAARQYGSGVAANCVADSMRILDDTDESISHPLDRSRLRTIATPQVFRRAQLLAALESAALSGEIFTDEATAVERFGGTIHLVINSVPNIKLTMPEDFDIAESLLSHLHERSPNG